VLVKSHIFGFVSYDTLWFGGGYRRFRMCCLHVLLWVWRQYSFRNVDTQLPDYSIVTRATKHYMGITFLGMINETSERVKRNDV
jgi:hypothetical protein